MKYNYDYSMFTKEMYNNFINNCLDEEDYIGAIHVGDISVDLVNHPEIDTLLADFYVAHEDTGYCYKEINGNKIPYDYADGIGIRDFKTLSYEEFKENVEVLLDEYIDSYEYYNYTLKDHANKSLEIW